VAYAAEVDRRGISHSFIDGPEENGEKKNELKWSERQGSRDVLQCQKLCQK
jgi:hypothetical protein